ncbi:Hint domain-containing protein [Thalassobium sp. R2A62]|uniref:Hint domain-containing protein n=1 Tax=Thalassobium sp. R2A62 TaxID=633131 RepID=UPI0001B1D525|nr:Hint domain-containing protein [Thalassobium sp. R2A62]EET49147.1 type I secretion target repeat protein [Thalassobium sp. R2A62]
MPTFTLFTLSTLPTGQFNNFEAGSSFRSDIESFSGSEIVEYGAATITDTDGNPNHGQDYHFDPDTPGQSMDAADSYTGMLAGQQIEFEESFRITPSDGSPSFLIHMITAATNNQYYGFVSEGQFDPTLTYTAVNEGADPGLVPYANLTLSVCFTRGTLIKTDQGERPIEELAAGDTVLTMDHGYQPIRWIGSSKRAATGDLAPILIRKGALGNDRDLRVSPQHRMLLQGWQAELLFGELEVLATAKSLLNDQTILRDEGGEVEYFHMLFDTHEIIYAEGCRSESFHPGQQGWTALDQATRDEILTLFPQLADGNFNDYGPAARMSLKHKEGKLLGAYMAGSV